LLALRWIESRGGPPPMPFATLVDTILPPGPLQDTVHELVACKKAGVELGEGPRIPVINEFVEQELARLAVGSREKGTAPKPSLEPLNRLFREMLAEVWGEQENEPK